MAGRTAFQPVPAQVENLGHRSFHVFEERKRLMSKCYEKCFGGGGGQEPRAPAPSPE